MNRLSVEQQYRVLLFTLSALCFSGAILELLLIGHTQSSVQLIPLVLCGIGLVSVVVTWKSVTRKTVRVYKIFMILIFLGGLFGIYEHFEHNLAFELEIRPNAVAGDVLWEALKGTSPLMAPGILPLGAILGYAAIWRHPRIST